MRIFISLVALLLVGGILYKVLTKEPALADESGFDLKADVWPPSTAELCRLANAHGTDPNTAEGRAVRERFTTIFKNRYRKHSPMMAVGVRFRESGSLDLLLPARMEPWNMDRIAVLLWHESQIAFGHKFPIDLYITFIGMAPVKVGELRPSPQNPNQIEVHYLTNQGAKK